MLSTIAVGSIGFSYDLYKKEQELSLERISIANELTYRIEIFEKQAKIPVFDCAKLIALKSTIDGDAVQAKKFRQFVSKVWEKDPGDSLFEENSNVRTFALISRYEINLNRSYFRRFIERPTMPIEEVIQSLRFAAILFDAESEKTVPMVDLYAYVVMTNFFYREVSKHYHKQGLDESKLDCGERWLGNI